MPVYSLKEGEPLKLKRIRIIADGIWRDGIFATQVLTWEDASLRNCDGLIHGYNMQSESPAYAREATLHQALRTAYLWLQPHDTTMIQYIAIRGGDYRMR